MRKLSEFVGSRKLGLALGGLAAVVIAGCGSISGQEPQATIPSPNEAVESVASAETRSYWGSARLNRSVKLNVLPGRERDLRALIEAQESKDGTTTIPAWAFKAWFQPPSQNINIKGTLNGRVNIPGFGTVTNASLQTYVPVNFDHVPAMQLLLGGQINNTALNWGLNGNFLPNGQFNAVNVFVGGSF